jgi:hypothetical protein
MAHHRHQPERRRDRAEVLRRHEANGRVAPVDKITRVTAKNAGGTVILSGTF